MRARTSRTSSRAALVFAALLLASGCRAILGIEDLSFDAGGPDATVDATPDAIDDATGDGNITVDGGVDATDSGIDVAVVDSGPDVVDTGPDVFDSGPDVTDTGADVFDSGPDVFDAGPPVPDAASAAKCKPMGAGACRQCCKGDYPGVNPQLEAIAKNQNCVCGTGACVTECASSVCVGTPPSGACPPCFDMAITSAAPNCGNARMTCASTVPGCAELTYCLSQCP